MSNLACIYDVCVEADCDHLFWVGPKAFNARVQQRAMEEARGDFLGLCQGSKVGC
jgi:hypothetical protein